MTSQVAPAIVPALAQKMAKTLAFLAADGVQKANSGHPGMPMGCADIATVLLTQFLRIDPTDPAWSNRDRLVLSNGHGSMLLYGMYYLAGMLELDELKNFRQLGSRTPGHPEVGITPGVEITTGPLATGFAAGIGMALAERMLADRYNTPKFDIVDHFTYIILGDGCLMEGLSQEAASFAGYMKLGRVIAIYDDNEISIEGSTDLAFTEDIPARFAALGWHVEDVDGHDHDALAQAITAAQDELGKPSLIIAHTEIGRGCPNLAGSADSHGAPLGEDEIRAAKVAAGFPDEAFHVSAEVLEAMTVRKVEWADIRASWDKDRAAFDKKHQSISKEFDRVMSGERPKMWKHSTPEFAAGESLASRASGGKVLNAFAEVLPELVGGSADLAPSTKTEIKVGEYPEFLTPGNYIGRNLHFGVREHAMGHIVNGMALHKGLIPFGSTFMVFHDFMRPALRLAAIMKLSTITVYTHDSIFVGEDGPTHQPIEQLAAMRSIPGVQTWRPADANEVAYAWQAALARTDGPTVLALSRQNLPTIERGGDVALAKETLKGGYILSDPAEEPAEILLVASGSELALAMELAELLRESERSVRVVSMPSLDVFKAQSEGYRKKVFPKRIKRRVVLEAGVIQGWEGILGENGIFVGMDGFGESGPAGAVADKFGFNVETILDRLADAEF